MLSGDLPNLLIIGAPKCGTTSMFRWLTEHPQICASNPKETWFFAGDELEYLKVRPNHRDDDLRSYLACFDSVNEATKIKVEGSTHYLYSDKALDFFSSTYPQPRLIVLLRDPAARIWSHFNYIKQRAKKPITISFADYVDQLIEGGEGCDLPFAEERWPRFLLNKQLSYSNYNRHLLKWRSRFPREHLYVATLDNLAGRKNEVAHEIAEWLGIDSTFYENYPFSIVNAARSRRAESFRRHLAKYSSFFPKAIVKKVKKTLDPILDLRKRSKANVDQQAFDKLREYFIVDNCRLRDEFNVDISRWS